MLESLFNKVAGRKDLKETSTQVFSCEYCKIFTKSFFYRTHPVARRSALLNQKQPGMVSTKKVYRSGHSTLFTNY